MTSLSDDFVADDFEPAVAQEKQEDDFVADDFQPDVKSERKLSELSWAEKHFTGEGQKLQAKANRNLVKGTISGVTAGYSQLIPGLEVEKDSSGTAGKITGSLLPLGLAAKAISYPLQATAYAIPKLAKPIQWLSNLMGISAAGGIYEGLEESAEKSLEAGEFVPPSVDTMLEKGAQWGALDLGLQALGWSARFTKALFDKSIELKQPAVDLLNRVTDQLKGSTDKIAEKALSILEGKPLQQIEKEAAAIPKTKDFSQQAIDESIQKQTGDIRSKKISQEKMDAMGTLSSIEMKPYLPGEFQATEVAENIINEDLAKRIEGVAQRSPSEKALGESVKSDIERTVKESKAETDALYDVAKKVESTRSPDVKQTANAIVEAINRIDAEGMNLTPEGYSRARKQLMDTLADLGFGVETDESGKIVRAILHEKQSLSKVVEVKKRLNNIINYDLFETSAQDFLKKPTDILRGEIRASYGGKNSEARKAFELAEEKFGEFAEKKGKKSIKNMRTTEKAESIAKTIRTPSGLADIKQVVSPEQFSQIERELLEYMQGLDEQKAANFYREMRESLTSDTRSIAEEIIASKAPQPSPPRKALQRETIQKKAIDDIAKATITGERPQVALDLWKTTEGQQLIKHALEDNPNKKEILKYLSDQSFKDFYSSIIGADGKIQFKKLDNLLKDKATIDNIRLVAGEEGVNFLKNLEKLSERVKKNYSIIEGKIDKGSASERRAVNKELEKHGEEIIKKGKEKREAVKKQVKDRYGNIIQEPIGKGNVSHRKAAQEDAKRLGQERFRNIKEKSIQEEKSAILYKLDEFLSSYGVKAKGVMAALGILKFGAVEGLSLSVGYEIFSKIARSKKVQAAFKKAASPNSSPASLVNVIKELMEELDED